MDIGDGLPGRLIPETPVKFLRHDGTMALDLRPSSVKAEGGGLSDDLRLAGGRRLCASREAQVLLDARASAWRPSCRTSPFKSLRADGVSGDYYTQCLSWGREYLALALSKDLILFSPDNQMQRSVAHLDSGDGVRSLGGGLVYPSAVTMSRFRDDACFLGQSTGAVGLYHATGDGSLACVTTFSMPTSSSVVLDGIGAFGEYNSSASSITGAALRASSASFTSVSCMDTSNVHPWCSAIGTACGDLFTLDARQESPALRFCTSSPRPPPCSATSTEAERLRSVANFLVEHERLLSVSWSASGSLLATGSDRGIVRIWAVSSLREPLHTIRVCPHTSLRALTFHPTNPHELMVGGDVGEVGVRIYDLSGACPRLSFVGHTSSQTTQVQYSPDGHHIVTAHGMRTDASPEPPTSRGRIQRDHVPDVGLLAEMEMDYEEEIVTRPVVPPSSLVGSEWPSFSLAVWRRRGGRERGECEDNSGDIQPNVPNSLVPLYALPGHRSRPVSLVTPFSHSTHVGSVASMAGGDDATVRFWSVFDSSSEEAKWLERQRGCLQTAITMDSMQRLTNPQLR